MFACTLTKADQTKRFVIADRGTEGWEIREESEDRDDRVVRRVLYTDWHRVERARLWFMRQASLLQDAGWVEARM